MTKYFVSVTKSVQEYWEVEADSEEEATYLYANGTMLSEKVETDNVDVYED